LALGLRLGSGLGLALGLCACEPVQQLVLSPVLPSSCVSGTVNELRVRGLGDFPPSAGQSASLGSGSADVTTLDLPRGTRVVTIEGIGALGEGAGLATFGRTAPLELPDAWDAGGSAHRLPIAYGMPDTFCVASSLAYPRSGHRATLLSDGSVLLSGGVNRDHAGVQPLERYLPTGDLDSPVAIFARVGTDEAPANIDLGAVLGHDATMLADGRVVLSGGAATGGTTGGGVADGIAYAGALVLTPDGHPEGQPTFLAGGPRAFHAGVLLADGRVLITGGCARFDAGACAPGQSLSSTAIYDPAQGAWSTGIPLLGARSGHQARLRDDGLVVIVGGLGEGQIALPPELYDPGEARGSTIAGPTGQTVMLPSGMWVALNDATGPSDRPVAWSARDEAPVALPQLPAVRGGATLTALEDGAILLAGGAPVATSLLLSTDGPVHELPGFFGRGHTATLLRDGSVLIAGGDDASGTPTAAAAVFLHSLVGPFDTPSTITFDGSAGLVPSRPAVATPVDGVLVVDASAGGTVAPQPQAFSVLAGPQWAGPSGAGFDLGLLAGRDGDAEAVILFGDPTQSRYVAITFAVGQPPRLLSVSRARPGLLTTEEIAGCTSQVVADAELPDGGLAPLTVHVRGGQLELDSSRPLLRCAADARVPARGALGLGALRGRVRWDNVQPER
jgi:hypothetical protein